MNCDTCNLPRDSEHISCTCEPDKSIPTPEVVFVGEDYGDVTQFERNLTWFLIGVLVTLVTCGIVGAV